MMVSPLPFLTLSLLTAASTANALDLDESSADSVCDAASLIINGVLDYYNGDGTFTAAPWWEYGVAFGSLMNFQHICSNDTYEDLIYEGLLSQRGDNNDYQPSSEDGNIGNDDIGTWGLSVIQAAEMGFKDPSDDGYPSWVELAENVFNVLYDRWDDNTCEGGLRWQFDSNRTGYDYKATIANANLFQLAARLARYTGNDTYVNIAEDIYDWIHGSGLTNDLEYGTEVYDGFDVSGNCSDITKVLWTYNYGVLIAGSAYLYNVTGDEGWKDEASSIITGSQILYNNTVLYERACETYDSCDDDQVVFKAVYSRYLGLTSQLIPSFNSTIQGLIEPSAKGAAESCSGGTDGHTCGINWGAGEYDGQYGFGQQLSALEIILNLIVTESDDPETSS